MTFPSKAFFLATALLSLALNLSAQSPAAKTRTTQSSGNTFTNPLGPGADPWIIKHEGAYYWCLSQNATGVAISKSDTPASIGKRRTVWKAPASGPYSKEIWAPELHFIEGRWYIYIAANDGDKSNHRMFVLESATDDPFSKYTYKGELYTGDNIAKKSKSRWAIDGTIFTHRGQRYFIWSGWENTENDQLLYIAPMSNPWTISGNRVRICKNDTYLWEYTNNSPEKRRGLNEGPQILERGGRTFLIYSASGCWQHTYKLGMLELIGDDPLARNAWRKFPKPVFSPTNMTFGVGHGAFTTSPDGTQYWQVFHAKRERSDGMSRDIFAQPFTWTADGLPYFGGPVPPGYPVPMPSDNNTSAS